MSLIAKAPSQTLVDLVGALGGRWSGHVAMCRCPAHDDNEPSLSIRQGDRGILVTCFAGCSRHDVLRELRRVRPDQHYAAPAPTIVRGSANVARIWQEATSLGDTLAERYLLLRNLSSSLNDLRFHPRCPYLPKPETLFLPALLVAVRELQRLVAIQRIFLDPHTADYAHKAMLGPPAAGAWRGGNAGVTVALAEGFETAAAFTELNAVPCWASLGARRLDQLTIPQTVTTLIIAEDNDAEGRRAAGRAAMRYARSGLRIERMPPPARFKDWADALDADRRSCGGSVG